MTKMLFEVAAWAQQRGKPGLAMRSRGMVVPILVRLLLTLYQSQHRGRLVQLLKAPGQCDAKRMSVDPTMIDDE